MRRDVGRHADGDAVGAVDEQVREPPRQHQRLAVFAVVVVDEINGVVLEAVEQFRGGKDGVINALVGQVMKQTQGRADARQVQELLRSKL